MNDTERDESQGRGGGDGGEGGGPQGNPGEDVLPEAVAEAIRRLLASRRLSQKALARRLGLTPTTVSRWLNRQSGVPLGQLTRVAEVLGIPLAELFAPALTEAERAGAVLIDTLEQQAIQLEHLARSLELLRVSIRAVPLYRTGAAGDPRRGEGDPQGARATSFAHRPPGTEQTVGPRGFAVVVEGEEVAGRGVRPGDVVFCNPDAPWAEGSLVVVGLGAEAGEDGPRPLALRELAYGPTRSLDARTAPEDGPPRTHPAGAYSVYGPVVVVLAVALLPEGRGHAEGRRRHGPGRPPEEPGGTPVQYAGGDGNGALVNTGR